MQMGARAPFGIELTTLQMVVGVRAGPRSAWAYRLLPGQALRPGERLGQGRDLGEARPPSCGPVLVPVASAASYR